MARKAGIISGLIVIFAAALVLFPQISGTFITLNTVDREFFINMREMSVVREVVLPKSGEFVLPGEVQIMVGMLRSARVSSFRFSSRIARNGPVMQRLVEGAWPIRVSDGSPYLVIVEGEPLPGGCSLLAMKEGAGLAYCR